MKAKELVAQYEQTPVTRRDALVFQIVKDLIDELVEIGRKRNCRDFHTIKPTLEEQNNKWLAFIRRLAPEDQLKIKETGFMDYLKFQFKNTMQRLKEVTL
jgi:hypothetical protein